MSHTPLRKEKDCLNCGTMVQGKYCHACGQPNVVPKETFWHMVTHFFNDITHFDGSFFRTVKLLLFKPGFLPKEYMNGRRASYLHPIRMYVFTSAAFFLLFFSFFAPYNSSFISTNIDEPLDTGQRESTIRELTVLLKKDTTNKFLAEAIDRLKDTSKPITRKETFAFYGKEARIISATGVDYASVAEYDSIQKSLPAAKRHGWFKRNLIRKVVSINERYAHKPEEAVSKLSDIFLHRLPYMLFVSLPLFALILRIVYFRRKQFYFADHGVFTIHLYIFTFLVLLAFFSINSLIGVTGWGWLNILNGLIFLLLFFYLYRAMRTFYGQGRWKTVIKFLIVSSVSLLMMLLLFMLFIFFSAYSL